MMKQIRTPRLSHLLPALLSLACSGSDTQVSQLRPIIAVAPESLDFGGVIVAYDDTQSLQLVNAGRAPLVIESLSIEDNGDSVFVLPFSSLEMDRDSVEAVDIRFVPETYALYQRDLVITSNDEDNPELRVPLLGEGIDGPVPDISIDLYTLDFGTVEPGEMATLWFVITNVGDGELIIEESLQSGSGNFTLLTDPHGQTLANQGDQVTVIVNYEPTQDEGDSGGLVLSTNDPDEPQVDIVFLGNGGGDFQYPEAIVDCPDNVDPPTTITLDGSDSFDPNGYTPLSYRWSLTEQPEGSTSELTESTSEYSSLFIDLSGSWQVDLTVENSVGVPSVPYRCEIEAIPSEIINVELTWNTGGSDLDLHLIQEGYDMNEKPGDCCWCNPNPSWGEAGTGDDPTLALDNRLGFGPENIELEAPQDGDYYVKVHYYEDDSGAGTTTATVKIWLDGEKVSERSMVLTENQVWDVGYIRWPEAVFAVQDDVDSAGGNRDCY